MESRELKFLLLRNSESCSIWKARVCVLEEFMLMSALWKEPIHSRSVPGKFLGIYIESVKILVILDPTGYMLTSSGFDLFI